MSVDLDRESEQAFHEGFEPFLVLHAAVNLLLYRGLGYPFAIRGMDLLPKQTEISGSVAEVLVTTTEENCHMTMWAEGWKKALKQCSRIKISFFVNDTCEPQHGAKEPRFRSRIDLFENGSEESFFSVDMTITRVRLPSLFFDEDGPDYRLDGSLKWIRW